MLLRRPHRALRRRSLSRPLSSLVDVYGWRNSPLVDASKCTDPLVGNGDLLVMPELITEDEEMVVAEECAKLLRRRRYEENHWDQVIIKFKEMERSRWSTETARILDKVRAAPVLPDLKYTPGMHVIDLAEDGYIMPHVDAIKFSGRVVAGLSLLSPSIMRFKEEEGESIVEAHLLRRSFYMMTGRIRYNYTHEILPGQQLFRGVEPVNRTRRISLMMRDYHPDDLREPELVVH